MSNLQLRIISAIFLAVIVLGLTWAGGLPFRLLAAAIGALVFYEWTTVSGGARDVTLHLPASILVALVLTALIVGVDATYLLLFAAITVAVLLVAGVTRGLGSEAAKGAAYALFPAISLAFLRGNDQSGLLAIVYLFAVVWATDIFAYFVGRAVGGPKLAPSISPGKTWSGAIGGTVFAVLAALAFAFATGHPSAMLIVALALPLSVISQVGDLYESKFKRRFGVKDSSNLIPGHGGVMDRADGLVAAAFALYLAGLFLSGANNPAAALFPA